MTHYKYRNEKFATKEYIAHKARDERPWNEYHEYPGGVASNLEYKLTREICVLAGCKEIPLQNWRSILMIAKCKLSNGAILVPFIFLPALCNSVYYTNTNEEKIRDSVPDLATITKIETMHKVKVQGLWAAHIHDRMKSLYPSSNWENAFTGLAKTRLCYLYISPDGIEYLCIAKEKLLKRMAEYPLKVIHPCSCIYIPKGQAGLRIKVPSTNNKKSDFTGLRITKNGALIFTGKSENVSRCFRALHKLVLESVSAMNISLTMQLLAYSAQVL